MPRHSLPILSPKSGDKKIRGWKRKRDKKKHQGDSKEALRKETGILEVDVYYYEIYEWGMSKLIS